MSTDPLNLHIDRPTQLVREQVVDVVREAILNGSLPAGRRLTERELGQMTGVSRTSVREAMRHLQTEGLLEKSRDGGLQVALLTEEVIGQLYDVRAALETAIVESFLRNASAEQRQLLARSRPATEDMEQRLSALRNFYKILLDGASNPILRQMYESIDVRIHALRRVSLRMPGRAENSRNEIDEMVRRIEAGDVLGAVELTREHVSRAKEAALAAARVLPLE